MDKTTISQNIKKNLKHYRTVNKLSQKEAATVFDVSLSAYQKYELDGQSVPSLSVLTRIADYYMISLDDLIGRPTYTKNTLIPESIKQTYIAMSNESKIEINALLTDLLLHWLNYTTTEKGGLHMDSNGNRRCVYVNFENENPHSKFVTGTYDKNMSYAFFEIPNAVGNTNAYLAPKDYTIGWTDPDGKHHTETIKADSLCYFRSDIITTEPKYR